MFHVIAFDGVCQSRMSLYHWVPTQKKTCYLYRFFLAAQVLNSLWMSYRNCKWTSASDHMKVRAVRNSMAVQCGFPVVTLHTTIGMLITFPSHSFAVSSCMPWCDLNRERKCERRSGISTLLSSYKAQSKRDYLVIFTGSCLTIGHPCMPNAFLKQKS